MAHKLQRMASVEHARRRAHRASASRRSARGIQHESPVGRRGHALAIASGALAVVSCVAASVLSLSAGSNVPSSVPGDADGFALKADPELEIDYVQQRRVLAALSQAGVDAESLAAAGASPAEATAVGAAVADTIDTLVPTLETANAAVLALDQHTDALERLLIAGQITVQQSAELAAARTQLATARAARTAAVDAIWDVAAEELVQATQVRLAHLADNCEARLPMNLRALDCTPSEWGALENAHTSVRVATQLEIDPDPAAVSMLADAQAEPAASAAAGWMASNLATIGDNLYAAAGQ